MPLPVFTNSYIQYTIVFAARKKVAVHFFFPLTFSGVQIRAGSGRHRLHALPRQQQPEPIPDGSVLERVEESTPLLPLSRHCYSHDPYVYFESSFSLLCLSVCMCVRVHNGSLRSRPTGRRSSLPVPAGLSIVLNSEVEALTNYIFRERKKEAAPAKRMLKQSEQLVLHACLCI